MRGIEAVVSDLDFGVSPIYRRGMWYLPYLLHAAIGIAIAVAGFPLLGACYAVGLLCHPVQGWAVNAFGHRFGYRNFATNDRSTNNLAVSWLIAGEGYQNNHHVDPSRANFGIKWWEFDSGYQLCRLAQAAGLVRIATH